MIADPAVLYSLGLVVAAGTSFSLAALISRQETKIAWWFGLLIALNGGWAVVAVVNTIAGSLGASTELLTMLERTQYVFTWGLNPVFFIAILYFVGWSEDDGTATVRWVAIGVWAVFALISFTDPFHGVVHGEYLYQTDPYRRVVVTATRPFYVVGVAVAVTIGGAGLVLAARFVDGFRRFGPTDLLTLCSVLFVGWILFGVEAVVSTTAMVEYVPIGIAAGTIPVTYLLMRGSILSSPPISREVAFNEVDSGIVAVDARGNIVDYNDRISTWYPDINDHLGRPVWTVEPGLTPDPIREAQANDAAHATDGGTAYERVRRGATGTTTVAERDDNGGANPLNNDDEAIHARTNSKNGAVTLAPGDYPEQYERDIQTDDSSTPNIGRGDVEVFEVETGTVNIWNEQRGHTLLIRDVTDRVRRKRRLERQSEKLDQFASVLSHDLRNPLTVATGYTEHLKTRGDPDDREEVINEIETALDRMGSMIDQTLMLARRGEEIDNPRYEPLFKIVARAWRNVSTIDTNIEFHFKPSLHVYSDPNSLQRIFENLFRNTIDHGPSDGTITVGVDTATNMFYVSDTGPGIPEDERNQVFEQGYSTDEDGIGLGLSIVSSIVEAHGWNVNVGESNSDGARFNFYNVHFDRREPDFLREPTTDATTRTMEHIHNDEHVDIAAEIDDDSQQTDTSAEVGEHNDSSTDGDADVEKTDS